MLLYRAVGLQELRLIYKLDLRGFPARRPEQPIFYPVLNFAYAEQIARERNTKTSDFAGYVTQFNVDDRYIARFERHIVGNHQHEELWVPADQLKAFNQHIRPPIMVTGAFFDPRFQGWIAERGNLRNKNAIDQFVTLEGIADYSGFDLVGDISSNRLAVFLNYAFWLQYDFTEYEIQADVQKRVLQLIADIWARQFPATPLPYSRPEQTEQGTIPPH